MLQDEHQSLSVGFGPGTTEGSPRDPAGNGTAVMLRLGQNITSTLSIVEVASYCELMSLSQSTPIRAEHGVLGVGVQWFPFAGHFPAGPPLPGILPYLAIDHFGFDIVGGVGAQTHPNATEYTAVIAAGIEWLAFRGTDYALGVRVSDNLSRPAGYTEQDREYLLVLRVVR